MQSVQIALAALMMVSFLICKLDTNEDTNHRQVVLLVALLVWIAVIATLVEIV